MRQGRGAEDEHRGHPPPPAVDWRGSVDFGAQRKLPEAGWGTGQAGIMEAEGGPPADSGPPCLWEWAARECKLPRRPLGPGLWRGPARDQMGPGR